MKMAAWVTVDGTGATRALAYTFLVDETDESFIWASECFKDAFRVPPAVIFTDSDPAMKVAIAAVFPSAEHLLCVWHLSKNMFTHIKAACGNNDALWKRMLSCWWLIVKQSDESSQETFEADFASLTAMLEESTVTGKTMESARKWLAKMADEKERWAYRWTWRWLTMGIHSTQRIESLHAHVMGYLRASTLLVELVPKLELYDATVSSRAETRNYRHIGLEHSAAKAQAHPFIDKLSQRIHPYALMLVKAQLAQAGYYRVDSTNEEGVFRVTRASTIVGPSSPDVEADGNDADVRLDSYSFSALPRMTTLTRCSCQFPCSYGLPCRHILRLCDVQQKAVPDQLCSPRWQFQSPSHVRELVEELRRRQPARTAPAQGLTRDDRFTLVMQACRPLAELAAVDSALYGRARDGLDSLVAHLRGRDGQAAPASAARRGRGAAAAAVEEVELAKAPEQCRGCWGFGHRKTNRSCPRFGLAALEKPVNVARAPAVTVRGGRKPVPIDEEEEEEEVAEDEDSHENVCNDCQETGELYCCSTCRHAYHEDCLSYAARAGLSEEDWRCPVCTGVFPRRAIGNPQAGKAQACAKRRARKRARGEAAPSAGRAAKRATYARSKAAGTAPPRLR